MYRRDDPRFRQRLNQLSHNVESATEHAQEGLYSFSQNYITPCLGSIGNSFRQCTESCFPSQEERRRRQRTRSRGRAEINFDFYDDWEEEENDALVGWGNGSDELDRLLASPSASQSQPGREGGMSYGTVSRNKASDNRGRRKSAAGIDDEDGGENVISGSNYIGFLERLPWRLGRKVLRYRPSAADLQEHPGAARRDLRDAVENEPLIEDSEEEFGQPSGTVRRKHKRNRSMTGSSGNTSDSRSSRGDLFPSDDEADAVPLDDEFAYTLTRKSTGDEDHSSGHSRPRLSKSNTRLSMRTVSSKSLDAKNRKTSSGSGRGEQAAAPPTFSELKAEEEILREEEEGEVARKRDAAQRLALKRGMSSGKSSSSKLHTGASTPKPEMTDVGSKSPSSNGTVPFPTFESPLGPQTPRSEADARLDSSVIEETPEVETPDQREEDEDPLAYTSPIVQVGKDEAFSPAALPRFSRSPPD